MFAALVVIIAHPPQSSAAEQRKIPVPDAAAVATASRTVRETFSAEYAKRSQADKRALSQKLGKLAVDERDVATRFVMLRESRDLAAAAGDASGALDGTEALGREFGIDVVAESLASLQRASASAGEKEAKGFTVAALRISGAAQRDGQLEPASQAAVMAVTAAKKAADPRLANAARARAAAAKDATKAALRTRIEVKRLEQKPDDPSANDEVGRFMCFVRNDWTSGLPLLVKGPPGPMKTAAAMDLEKVDVAGPGNTDMAIGDAWWGAPAADKSPFHKSAMRRRAGFWYRRAVPKLEGLAKVPVERRLREIAVNDGGAPSGTYEARHPAWKDTLQFDIDGRVSGASQKGTWTWDGSQLVMALNGYPAERPCIPDGSGGFISDGGVTLEPVK